MTDEERERLYIEAVGHAPVWKDDPDWLYTGSAEEREALKKRLGIEEDEPVEQLSLL